MFKRSLLLQWLCFFFLTWFLCVPFSNFIAILWEGESRLSSKLGNPFIALFLLMFLGVFLVRTDSNQGGVDFVVEHSSVQIISINLLSMTRVFNLLTLWPQFILFNSFTFWVSSMIDTIIRRPSSSLSHFTPHGLPILGSLFIGGIESVSNLIRPLTLGLRLVANISRGHLFMEILYDSGGDLHIMGCYERFVCFIQGIIFSTLTLSYITEYDSLK